MVPGVEWFREWIGSGSGLVPGVDWFREGSWLRRCLAEDADGAEDRDARSLIGLDFDLSIAKSLVKYLWELAGRLLIGLL